MNNYRSLNHTKWECQYHVVFIPKYRRKTLYPPVPIICETTSLMRLV